LSDNGAWERRKTKGKVAIQKMVVDLMELYLHRLKQRRPPYPKTPAMVDFSAQFPYEPTPDQKQVATLSCKYLLHCLVKIWMRGFLRVLVYVNEMSILFA
jgi:hypothetical protein